MNNIENLRFEKGLNQKELANILEISQSAISEWEKELRLPKIEHLIKMSDLFEESIDFIIGRESYTGNAELTNEFTTKENELIGYFRKINSFNQGQLLGVARTLAKGI